MEIITMIGQLILALAILVTLHEWGHFQAARSFGIKVEKFYLFFDAWGVKLFKFKKGDTEYGIGWLPLGGYVKISGMIDESMDKEFQNQEPKDYEFRSKPAWQRLIVMIGGVTVNAILSIVIFTAVTMVWGVSYLPIDSMKDGIAAMEVGQEIGFESGDKPIAINGKRIERFKELAGPEVLLGEDVVVTVERAGKEIDIAIPQDFARRVMKDRKKGFDSFLTPRRRLLVAEKPEDQEVPAYEAGLMEGDYILEVAGKPARFYDQLTPILQDNKGKEVTVKVDRSGSVESFTARVDTLARLGFIIENTLADAYQTEFLSFGQSLSHGSSQAFGSVTGLFLAFKKMFAGDIDPTKAFAGPIQIAQHFGSTWDWQRFWSLTGMLSMILAFMNILPIPALDGGHVLFLAVEMVTGKPLSDKALEIAQQIGMVILLALMVFIFGNDIYQTIFN